MKPARIALLLMMLVAVNGTAQMVGRHRPSTPGMGSGMGMMDLIVAADGTVIVQEGPASTALKPRLVAISPGGSTLWTWDADDDIAIISTAGSLVLVATGDLDAMISGQATTGKLTALTLDRGLPAWSFSTPGVVMNLTPAGQQIYAVIAGSSSNSMPMMGGSGSRTLLALDQHGGVLWSRSLVP